MLRFASAHNNKSHFASFCQFASSTHLDTFPHENILGFKYKIACVDFVDNVANSPK
jgi:hypothetical protein